jgi:hypothetical protein
MLTCPVCRTEGDPSLLGPRPETGAISICATCGEAVVVDGAALRSATDEDLRPFSDKAIARLRDVQQQIRAHNGGV